VSSRRECGRSRVHASWCDLHCFDSSSSDSDCCCTALLSAPRCRCERRLTARSVAGGTTETQQQPKSEPRRSVLLPAASHTRRCASSAPTQRQQAQHADNMDTSAPFVFRTTGPTGLTPRSPWARAAPSWSAAAGVTSSHQRHLYQPVGGKSKQRSWLTRMMRKHKIGWMAIGRRGCCSGGLAGSGSQRAPRSSAAFVMARSNVTA